MIVTAVGDLNRAAIEAITVVLVMAVIIAKEDTAAIAKKILMKTIRECVDRVTAIMELLTAVTMKAMIITGMMKAGRKTGVTMAMTTGVKRIEDTEIAIVLQADRDQITIGATTKEAIQVPAVI